jgi:hypothetical protein
LRSNLRSGFDGSLADHDALLRHCGVCRTRTACLRIEVVRFPRSRIYAASRCCNRGSWWLELVAGIDSARQLSTGQVLRKLRASGCRWYDIFRESRLTCGSLGQNLAPISTISEAEQQEKRNRSDAKAGAPIEADRLFGRRMKLQPGRSFDRFDRRFTVFWAVILSGSARQSEQGAILRGFLKYDELGPGRGHSLGFEQEVAEIRIATAAA